MSMTPDEQAAYRRGFADGRGFQSDTIAHALTDAINDGRMHRVGSAATGLRLALKLVKQHAPTPDTDPGETSTTVPNME